MNSICNISYDFKGMPTNKLMYEKKTTKPPIQINKPPKIENILIQKYNQFTYLEIQVHL